MWWASAVSAPGAGDRLVRPQTALRLQVRRGDGRLSCPQGGPRGARGGGPRAGLRGPRGARGGGPGAGAAGAPRSTWRGPRAASRVLLFPLWELR